MQNIGALKIPSRTDAEQALSQFRPGRRQTFFQFALAPGKKSPFLSLTCLLYTSDAADE